MIIESLILFEFHSTMSCLESLVFIYKTKHYAIYIGHDKKKKKVGESSIKDIKLKKQQT